MNQKFNRHSVKALLDRFLAEKHGIAPECVYDRSVIENSIYKYHDFQAGIAQEFFVLNYNCDLATNDTLDVPAEIFENMEYECVDTIALLHWSGSILAFGITPLKRPDEWQRIVHADGSISYSPKKIKNT